MILSNYLDREKFHTSIVLALCLLQFFPFLGARDFWDIETQYAEVIRVMVLEGNYILPTMNGEVWTESPPFYFWLAVLVSRLVGRVDEWTIRLPSALSAAELILIYYFFVRRRFGMRLALLSALVLTSSVLTVHVERHVPINMTFYLFVVIALFLMMEILVFNSDRPSHAYGAWVAAGLASLTNGAVGIFLPALIAAPYLVYTRRWRQATALRPLTGTLVFLAVLAPWAVAIYIAAPDGWLRIILAQLGAAHHLGHASADHQFFFRFPLALSPWVFLIVPALMSLWPYRSYLRDHPNTFLFIWFLAALIVSEVFLGYHSHYVFLTLFPAAIGVAVYLNSLVSGAASPPVRLWTHRSVAILAALLIVSALAAPPVVIAEWPVVKISAIALALASILGSAFVFYASRQTRDQAFILGLAVFAVVINAVLQGLLFPTLNALNGRPFAERLGQFVASRPGARVAILKDTRLNFYNYYSGIKRFETLRGGAEFNMFFSEEAPRYVLVRDKGLKSVQDVSHQVLTPVLSGTTTRGTWLLVHACQKECDR